MSRRKKEPDLATLLHFIADHESLALTAEEFGQLTEGRLRELLHAAAERVEPRALRKGESALPTSSDILGKGSRRRTAASSRRAMVFSDGASRGNPGPAAAGWVIRSPAGEVIAEGGAFLGRRTNNEAEYEAVIRALAAALELGVEEVALRADSELLIKQINGEYQVRNERIAVLHRAARELLQRFRRFEAKHVRREENQAADAMANEALDSARGRPSALRP